MSDCGHSAILLRPLPFFVLSCFVWAEPCTIVSLGLKVMGSLKTRNIALPLQTCTLGYPGMSVHSEYKAAYKFYLKKIQQVLVEQEEKYDEFRVIRRKPCLTHVQDENRRINLIQSNVMYIQSSVQNIRPWR